MFEGVSRIACHNCVLIVYYLTRVCFFLLQAGLGSLQGQHAGYSGLFPQQMAQMAHGNPTGMSVPFPFDIPDIRQQEQRQRILDMQQQQLRQQAAAQHKPRASGVIPHKSAPSMPQLGAYPGQHIGNSNSPIGQPERSQTQAQQHSASIPTNSPNPQPQLRDYSSMMMAHHQQHQHQNKQNEHLIPYSTAEQPRPPINRYVPSKSMPMSRQMNMTSPGTGMGSAGSNMGSAGSNMGSAGSSMGSAGSSMGSAGLGIGSTNSTISTNEETGRITQAPQIPRPPVNRHPHIPYKSAPKNDVPMPQSLHHVRHPAPSSLENTRKPNPIHTQELKPTDATHRPTEPPKHIQRPPARHKMPYKMDAMQKRNEKERQENLAKAAAAEKRSASPPVHQPLASQSPTKPTTGE